MDSAKILSIVSFFFFSIVGLFAFDENEKRVKELERKVEHMERIIEILQKRKVSISVSEEPDERRKTGRYLRRLGDEMFLREVEKGNVKFERGDVLNTSETGMIDECEVTKNDTIMKNIFEIFHYVVNDNEKYVSITISEYNRLKGMEKPSCNKAGEYDELREVSKEIRDLILKIKECEKGLETYKALLNGKYSRFYALIRNSL